jgi:single-strand DNA-binding protein
MNQLNVIGNLTKDPETRSVGETSVTQFGVALNRRFKGKDGEPKEVTTFVDCECWGAKGETIAKFLEKGRKVYLTGELKMDSWEDKESGAKRSKLLMNVMDFEFVDSKGGEETSSQPAAKAAPKAKAKAPVVEDDDSEDIPF